MKLKPLQRGFSLIEVLVAMLIMTIGLMGAAAIQLNALKYTDSSAMRTQASFIAYDMLDRIRANNLVNYSIASAMAATTTTATSDPRALDWSDFKGNITSGLGGTTNNADGSIVIANNVITITIKWGDSRAGKTLNAINASAVANDTSVQTFTLVSRAFNDATVTQ
ncbi:pre-pilin leader sequence [Pseudomonas sp. M47T1]|uniref:type IV pilus modification protein PilV n=1 Tax=unclassified Pseudomonas TaxID=196821 RepID=UPI0002606BF6|nr:type IV pilus modification protein PilV [Pseudomonas sp. M47T1]EIK95191.1 pre-pilin leader sequence [Pseudomonas sp. M47T1]